MIMIWIDFYFKAFTERYISEAYVDRTKIEFLELRQNDSSVADYEAQIERLLKYVSEKVTIDELKQKKLEKRLNVKI